MNTSMCACILRHFIDLKLHLKFNDGHGICHHRSGRCGLETGRGGLSASRSIKFTDFNLFARVSLRFKIENP